MRISKTLKFSSEKKGTIPRRRIDSLSQKGNLVLLPSRFKTHLSEKSYSNEASYLEDGLSNSPFSITSNVSCRAFLTFKDMFVCLLNNFTRT